jgi:hypothetical protein
VGLNQRDTICFTVGEVLTVNDSLWSGVDGRAKRVIMARLIAEYSSELKATQQREAIERQRADLASGNVADLVTAADQFKKDAEFWERKAKGRGWRGFLYGVLAALGALTAYLLAVK